MSDSHVYPLEQRRGRGAMQPRVPLRRGQNTIRPDRPMLTSPEPATTAEIDEFVRLKYPYFAAFLNDPELGPILREAALTDAGEQELFGMIQPTRWWQTTSAAARQWELTVTEDPAEAGRLAGQTAATIQNRARSLGLSMSADEIQRLALDATKNGWTDSQVVDQLLQNLNWSSVRDGDLTALADQVRSIGSDYLVDVSDTTAQQYAAAIASGEMSEAGVASAMQRQARSRFGWMADEIDQGVTPALYFAPVRDVIARELELAPETVNLMDSEWLGMIETRDDDGTMRAATLEEARLAARRDPRFANTGRARELTFQAGAALGDVFGRRAI